VGVLGSASFHIEQISTKLEALSAAISQQDAMTAGLSIQTLSVTAQVARSQFTPSDRTVALSWQNWLVGLGFLQNCVAGVIDGDPDIVALSHDLLSLSHEEFLHLLALSEQVDRRQPWT